MEVLLRKGWWAEGGNEETMQLSDVSQASAAAHTHHQRPQVQNNLEKKKLKCVWTRNRMCIFFKSNNVDQWNYISNVDLLTLNFVFSHLFIYVFNLYLTR